MGPPLPSTSCRSRRAKAAPEGGQHAALRPPLCRHGQAHPGGAAPARLASPGVRLGPPLQPGQLHAQPHPLHCPPRPREQPVWWHAISQRAIPQCAPLPHTAEPARGWSPGHPARVACKMCPFSPFRAWPALSQPCYGVLAGCRPQLQSGPAQQAGAHQAGIGRWLGPLAGG